MGKQHFIYIQLSFDMACWIFFVLIWQKMINDASKAYIFKNGSTICGGVFVCLEKLKPFF